MTRRREAEKECMSRIMSNNHGWIFRLSLPLLLVAQPCLSHAQVVVLGDDFADVASWKKGASHQKDETVTSEGVRVEIKSGRDSSRPAAFLRVEDHSSQDHWFWVQKRKARGAWDLGRATRITLWTRSSGAQSVLRLLVGDSRGNVAYYALGNLGNTNWAQQSLDLQHVPPYSAVGAVDWCSVTLLGLRTDSGHGYTFDYSDLRIEADAERAIAGEGAENLLRPPTMDEDPLGFLAPVASGDLDDSMLALNVGLNVENDDLDRIARAGVKWAKVSCSMSTGDARLERMVDALLARHIRVVGHLPQTTFWSKEMFPEVKGVPGDRAPFAYSPEAMAWFLERLRSAAERLKGRIGVWEIGNEPDIAKFWMPTPNPTAFGKFVIETSKVLKSVDPKNQVISGGVCGFWGVDFPGARNFLTAFFQTGAGAHIDILGLHPFRARPEAGAANLTQRQTVAELRQLMTQFGLSLPIWDTEWQITPSVERSEVPFATDLYEAKGMLRKYLVEANAGFLHLNWQLAKAGAHMDHPGQIFTADGRSTAKYATLRHAGALLAKIKAPMEIPVSLAEHAAKPATAVLVQASFDEPSVLQAWRTTGDGASATIDTQLPFRGRSALKLSGSKAARIDFSERWQPIQGATIVEVRGVLKGNGCDVVIQLAPRDIFGSDLPPPPSPKKPFLAQPDYAPFCFRFLMGPDWHDFGLRLELPKGGSAWLDDLTVLYHVPPPELVSFAFALRGSPAPAVFFWSPVTPSDQQRRRAADLSVSGLPDAKFVLLDTLTGEIHRLAKPQRGGDRLLFHNLPLCDYPMAIVPQDAFPTSPAPAWLTDFADANEVVSRSFRDRTGDFYLRGFWNMAGGVAERLPLTVGTDPRLSALRRAHSFWRAFAVAPEPITILSAALSRTTLRLPPEAWHDSVANAKSRHVNRFLYRLTDAEQRATVHAEKLGEQTLPERPWADSPDNAFTWFTLCRESKPSEVFVVIPKDQTLAGRNVSVDVSLPSQVKAMLLSSRATETQCVAYWVEDTFGQADVACTIEFDARPSWAADVVVLDPRTGKACGRAAVKKREGAHVVLEAPATSQPRLLVNRSASESDGLWR